MGSGNTGPLTLVGSPVYHSPGTLGLLCPVCDLWPLLSGCGSQSPGVCPRQVFGRYMGSPSQESAERAEAAPGIQQAAPTANSDSPCVKEATVGHRKEAGLGLLSPKQSWSKTWVQAVFEGDCRRQARKGIPNETGKDSKRELPELGPCGPLGHLKEVLRAEHG